MPMIIIHNPCFSEEHVQIWSPETIIEDHGNPSAMFRIPIKLAQRVFSHWKYASTFSITSSFAPQFVNIITNNSFGFCFISRAKTERRADCRKRCSAQLLLVGDIPFSGRTIAACDLCGYYLWMLAVLTLLSIVFTMFSHLKRNSPTCSVQMPIIIQDFIRQIYQRIERNIMTVFVGNHNVGEEP